MQYVGKYVIIFRNYCLHGSGRVHKALPRHVSWTKKGRSVTVVCVVLCDVVRFPQDGDCIRHFGLCRKCNHDACRKNDVVANPAAVVVVVVVVVVTTAVETFRFVVVFCLSNQTKRNGHVMCD